MSIIRGPRKQQNFYILDKSISEDKRLTWGARGLLIFLLGKPDNWKVSTQALINETNESRLPSGRDAVRGFIIELIDCGYMQRSVARTNAGQIVGYDYVVNELPATAEPATAEPATANPPLISTDTSSRTEEPNKDSLFPDAVPAPERRKSDRNPLNDATWKAYSAAYFQRYGVDPVRNAAVNSQIANFVKRLGENAPHVAAHYVTGNSSFYLTKGHGVGPMLADAEKLHTEWATGRRVTQSAARQADRSQSNLDNSRTALDMLNQKYGSDA